MNKKIKLLELFAGVGGFALGLKEAGFEIEKHYFSEILPHSIANYKHNFKDSIHVGNVKLVRRIIKTVGRPDVITFGSPCQDFSLAGKGRGLGGDRSSLIKFAVFLVRWLRPNFFIWENVKGAYSTNDGADYWAIIKAFTDLHGYRLEQQLVNTSWVLPQNRERIYLIGHLTGASEPRVFPFTGENFGISSETEKKRGKGQRFQNENNATAITKRYGNNSTETLVQVKKAIPLREVRTDEAKEDRKRNRAAGRDTNSFRGKMIEERDDDLTGCLSSAPTNDNLLLYKETSEIRKLTEIECERLQGFPDDWTKYGLYEDGKVKPIPKTARYEMLGNAVTVKIVKAIGERLLIDQNIKFI